MATTGALTDYAERQALDFLFRDTNKTYYFALFTESPTETSGGTEVSTEGTGYARQTITFSAASTDANGKTTIANSNQITFPEAQSSWGTIYGGAVFDDEGNMLMFGSLESPQTVNTGNVVQFPVGSITVELD